MRNQIPLDLGLPEPEAPEGWREIARGVMDELISTGKPFDSWTLTERGVPRPPHPAQWGALFLTYSMKNLIEPVGHRRSRRRTRNSGDCQTWRGTEKARRRAA